MKIVLTHGYFLLEDEKEQKIMRPYPTLGLLYISSYLKIHSKNIKVIDTTFLHREEWKNALRNESPTVIAFYSNLVTKINLLQLIDWISIEFPSCRLIVGGPDVRYNLENYLNAGFHYAIIGEGEQTMLELCNALASNSSVDSIQGIAYLKEGLVHQNAERSKIKELSEIPFPDRDAIDIERYLEVWKKHHGKRTLNISTQRGCPYTCKWCSTAV